VVTIHGLPVTWLLDWMADFVSLALARLGAPDAVLV